MKRLLPHLPHLLLFILLFASIGSYFVFSSHAASNPIGDLNNDGTVSIFDLSILLGHWSQSSSGITGDLNNDNTVNIFDLSILLGHWGETASEMHVGLNETGWGVNGVQDIAASVQYARWDTSVGEPASDYYNNGVKVDVAIPGTCPSCGYSNNGVQSINASSWASSALSFYQQQCPQGISQCPELEVLNEPNGSWFWGSNATSSSNEAAYDSLLIATYNDFHGAYGFNAPKILGAYDSTWGPGLYTQNSSIGNYVDGWTVHPYGGTGDPTSSAQGNRQLVTDAHNATGKPIYITEVGWPTDCNSGCPTTTNDTGDSLQWNEQQQADNIYNFINWARSTGYVASVYIFGYADYGTNNFYGVMRWGNPAGANYSHKSSFNALRCAALNEAENCAP